MRRPLSALVPLCTNVTRSGYAFVPGAEMRGVLQTFGPMTDWPAFAASWADLGLDTYMADGGRYRRRRHAVYSISGEGAIAREAHRPHYQAHDYNPMNGGVERWFEPVDVAIGEGTTLRTILRCCHALFQALAGDAKRWTVEVHQFRIEARRESIGLPTPEGMHRDGVDFVLVLLIERRNIARGVTTIRSSAGEELGTFTLTVPLDGVVVDDARVYHGVTPVESIDPTYAAHRDVLVVTFLRSS